MILAFCRLRTVAWIVSLSTLGKVRTLMAADTMGAFVHHLIRGKLVKIVVARLYGRSPGGASGSQARVAAEWHVSVKTLASPARLVALDDPKIVWTSYPTAR
jgi:hypothetical protein